MQIEVIGKLSIDHHPYIIKAVQKAVEDTPEAIIDALKDYRIKIARRLIDINPEASTQKARGYGGKTLDHTSGTHTGRTREIQITQESVTSEYWGEKNYSYAWQNRYSVTLHEIGHGFDAIDLDHPKSAGEDFVEAYEKDVARLRSLDINERSDLLDRFSYFFDSRTFNQGRQTCVMAARSEVFAEAFANIIGGTHANYDADKDLQAHRQLFAHCYDIVEKRIREIVPNLEAFPNRDRVYIADYKPVRARISENFRSNFRDTAQKEHANDNPTLEENTVAASKPMQRHSAPVLDFF